MKRQQRLAWISWTPSMALIKLDHLMMSLTHFSRISTGTKRGFFKMRVSWSSCPWRGVEGPIREKIAVSNAKTIRLAENVSFPLQGSIYCINHVNTLRMCRFSFRAGWRHTSIALALLGGRPPIATGARDLPSVQINGKWEPFSFWKWFLLTITTNNFDEQLSKFIQKSIFFCSLLKVYLGAMYILLIIYFHPPLLLLLLLMIMIRCVLYGFQFWSLSVRTRYF